MLDLLVLLSRCRLTEGGDTRGLNVPASPGTLCCVLQHKCWEWSSPAKSSSSQQATRYLKVPNHHYFITFPSQMLFRCNSQLIHAYFCPVFPMGSLGALWVLLCMPTSGLNAGLLFFQACTPRAAPSLFLSLLVHITPSVVLLLSQWTESTESRVSAQLKGSVKSTICWTSLR